MTVPSPPRTRYVIAAAALGLVSIVAVVFALNTDPASLGIGRVDPDNLAVGPAVPGLDGGVGWVNSPDLAAGDLAGKVVVYDFWTYSCVNCVRTLPYLRSWYDRYAGDGLVIVGVHSPEFNFERSRPNVEAAVRRLGVTWPVILDNDMAIWNRFSNNYWPAKYVADRDGRLRYHHIGEGGYEETEDVLRALLGVADDQPRAAEGPPSAADQEREERIDAAGSITAETYLGLLRGFTAVPPAGPATYPEPAQLASGEAGLVGVWISDNEKVTSGAEGAAIVIPFRAREANLVMTPSATGPVDVVVELDGAPLPPAYRTADTVVEASGATVIRVDRDDMFLLVLGPGVEEHTLRLTARAPGLGVFAFTFGA